jgi:cytidylate kinase
MIIAVDGPAGAGKSTVAKRLAQKLGFLYIDTGAMYRALTLKAIEENIDSKDIASLVKSAASSTIDLRINREGLLKIFLDDDDVTAQIREPRITKLVSDIAKIKGVRDIMVKLQRELGKQKDSVLDGRDIGTVVFPDADKKFYIDAQFKERVRRRYKELEAQGLMVTMESVASDLRNRDEIDSTREHSPLKKADDAVYVDTTDMTIEEVVKGMLREIGK